MSCLSIWSAVAKYILTCQHQPLSLLCSMKWIFVITFLFLIIARYCSHSATTKGESRINALHFRLLIHVFFHHLVGQCQRSDGKCSEASDCKYVWTDTFDCTVKSMVCCYNNRIYSNHDYVDLGWWRGFLQGFREVEKVLELDSRFKVNILP